jgi:hypothetical protein
VVDGLVLGEILGPLLRVSTAYQVLTLGVANLSLAVDRRFNVADVGPGMPVERY